MVHFYLYAATPFVHQAVQPNLKQFIVPKWSMRHHNTIVEFIKWSLPLSCSVVVEKLYQTSMTLVKPVNIVEDDGDAAYRILLLLYTEECGIPWTRPEAEAIAIPD